MKSTYSSDAVLRKNSKLDDVWVDQSTLLGDNAKSILTVKPSKSTLQEVKQKLMYPQEQIDLSRTLFICFREENSDKYNYKMDDFVNNINTRVNISIVESPKKKLKVPILVTKF